MHNANSIQRDLQRRDLTVSPKNPLEVRLRTRAIMVENVI
jgi:hypothetical protein